MSIDYESLLIQSYKHWKLYLHSNQSPYPGRCYAAAIRDEADLLTDMTPQEREELFEIIIPDWKLRAQLIAPIDRENLAILGNTWPHLHAHLIPRRFYSFEYEKVVFTDPNPNGNYVPYEKKDIGNAVREVILRTMKYKNI